MCEQLEECGYVSRYLTHFVGRHLKEEECVFRLLCRIIRSGRLLPGGSDKSKDGDMRIEINKPLSSNEMFTPEMVCFCDIPLNDRMLAIHTRRYSRFGLAFDKKWLARKRGANPVFYIAKGSCCTDHRFAHGHPCRQTTREAFFNHAAHEWIECILEKLKKLAPKPSSLLPAENKLLRVDSSKLSPADNMFLWYVLGYCKFFDEELSQEDPDNFYMEREWRTIGYVEFSQDNIACVLLPPAFKDRLTDQFSCLGDKIHTIKSPAKQAETS